MSYSIFFQEIQSSFNQLKSLAESAMAQLSDEEFLQSPGPDNNSVAIIAKHLGGNLTSRWGDFLESDGEKSNRNRDSEFVIEENEGREVIMKIWNDGWLTLMETLASLTAQDFQKTVRIRAEPHSVPQAIVRSLSHVSWHVGQIMYVSRLVHQTHWHWLTVAPGKSEDYTRSIKERFDTHE